jgi:hypothetical protein
MAPMRQHESRGDMVDRVYLGGRGQDRCVDQVCRLKRGDMSSNAVQVFIAAYESEDGANAALKDFRTMHREGSIELIDEAVAVHRADGKVKIEWPRSSRSVAALAA